MMTMSWTFAPLKLTPLPGRAVKAPSSEERQARIAREGA